MTEVVVLGAGYAGLKTVRDLQKQVGDVNITLIDRNSYHYEEQSFMKWLQVPIRQTKSLSRL